MKRSILLTAVLALAACNSAESDEANSPEAPASSGERDRRRHRSECRRRLRSRGPRPLRSRARRRQVDELTVLPGMTWAMVFADGEPAGGTIFAQGGKNCFVTEGVEGHQCFDGSEPAADGSMKVTAEDGEVMTVRPVKSFD